MITIIYICLCARARTHEIVRAVERVLYFIQTSLADSSQVHNTLAKTVFNICKTFGVSPDSSVACLYARLCSSQSKEDGLTSVLPLLAHSRAFQK